MYQKALKAYHDQLEKRIDLTADDESFDTEMDKMRHLRTIVQEAQKMDQTTGLKWKLAQWPVDPTLIFTGVMNLTMLLIVLNYEKTDILTTRAGSFMSLFRR